MGLWSYLSGGSDPEKVFLYICVPPEVRRGERGVITVLTEKAEFDGHRPQPGVDAVPPTLVQVARGGQITLIGNFDEECIVLRRERDLIQDKAWEGEPTSYQFRFTVAPNAVTGSQVQCGSIRVVTLDPTSSEELSEEMPVTINITACDFRSDDLPGDI